MIEKTYLLKPATPLLLATYGGTSHKALDHLQRGAQDLASLGCDDEDHVEQVESLEDAVRVTISFRDSVAILLRHLVEGQDPRPQMQVVQDMLNKMG